MQTATQPASADPAAPPSSHPSATTAPSSQTLQPLLPAESAAQLSARCGQFMSGAISCLGIYLGHELGLYKTLSRLGPSTSQQLADATGLSERWVREWCYQASAARMVCCDEQAERFWMSEAQTEVLVEPETLEDARETPLEMCLKMPLVLGKHDKLLGAFKTGLGLSFDDTGIDHCQMHRHARAIQLEQRLRLLPGLIDKLQQGVKVADVGCGSGEVVMHLASLFPNSTFVGYDISTRALSSAHERMAARGLTNVTCLNPADGPDSRLPGTPTFHLIVVLDAIHDMTAPQEMLKIIHSSLLQGEGDNSASNSSGSSKATEAQTQQQQQQQQPVGDLPDALSTYNGGPVFLVTDIKSTGSPASNIATMPSAPFLYGVSLGICMSSALSEAGGAGLGTVGWHEDAARKMSAAAGFKRFTKLEWEADNSMQWHSHYMLTP